MNATDDGTNLSAMAVEPDSTLWLVHVSGHAFRVGLDGELVPGPAQGRPIISELAAA